ncbi:MAG TPA: chromate transporter [Spirochaetota bacterium]|nr:chromate transporter [Spirochaetota bacterium]HPH03677.1 chromate transporter [Spirochaetota bacterium]
MNLLTVFLVFFKIGLAGFGGGNAMIPLIHEQLVHQHGLLDEASFANLVALSQSTPGPFVLNIATWVGYREAGWAGALTASLAVCLPGFVLTFFGAMLLARSRSNRFVQHTLVWLQPVFAGLIGATVINLLPQGIADPLQAALALVCFIAVGIGNVHPMVMLGLGALAGILAAWPF